MFLPREHPTSSCALLGSSFPCCCCFRLNFYEVVFPHFTCASLFFIRSSLPGEAARSRVPALPNTLSSVKTWVVFEKHCNRSKKKVQHYKENLLCFYDGDRCWAWGLMPGKSGLKQSDKDRMCFFILSLWWESYLTLRWTWGKFVAGQVMWWCWNYVDIPISLGTSLGIIINNMLLLHNAKIQLNP